MTNCINSYSDLVTLHTDVVQGFLNQAKKKVEVADPFVAEALVFKDQLQNVQNERDLLLLIENPTILSSLISAAGLSDKAKSHLSDSELVEAIIRLFEPFRDQNGDYREDFRDNVLYRYLLTKGDSLGGKMRNIVGSSAEERFYSSVLETLGRDKVEYIPHYTSSGNLGYVRWDKRMLFLNKTPKKIVNKNIDFILVDTTKPHREYRDLLGRYDAFLACGELKGGIDPAGADEHWKTARSALQRIKDKFEDDKAIQSPQLFFVAAAIENSMAAEIFRDLQSGFLNYAANLNNSAQVQDLVDWLVTL